MRRIFCDRCGKEIDSGGPHKFIQNSTVRVRGERRYVLPWVDLCDACVDWASAHYDELVRAAVA